MGAMELEALNLDFLWKIIKIHKKQSTGSTWRESSLQTNDN